MDLKQRNHRVHLLELIILWYCFKDIVSVEEARECQEKEYRATTGNCMPCVMCAPGQESSTECGFGFGEGAQCVPCRPGRFKEDSGLQKCKPCLGCARVNLFQRSNCTSTSNAVCGDCLPGFHRRTRLSGFQDSECIPCGDPPPAYEPQCSSRVNLVPLSPGASSPRHTALAAVVCVSLGSVLLALLMLCTIYCRRHLERKPHGPRQEEGCPGSELSWSKHSQVQQLPDSSQQNIINCSPVWTHTSGALVCPCWEEPHRWNPVPGPPFCCSQISHNHRVPSPSYSAAETFSGRRRYPSVEEPTGPHESTLTEGDGESPEGDEEGPGEERRLEDGTWAGEINLLVNSSEDLSPQR